MYQIPWEKYSEEEIQEIISYMFKVKGYDIYNVHKIDRRGEKGVDIECTKSFESDKILITIKKKPGKKDILQLKTLGERVNKNKIYIYISEPSTSFKKEMDKLKNKISFWDSKKLTLELFNTDLKFYIFIIIENYYEKESFEISYLFMTYYENLENINIKNSIITPLNKDILKILWFAKDRSTSLHKSLLTISDLFEQSSPLFLDDKGKIKIVYGFLKSLINLKDNSLIPLKKRYKELLNKYPENFYKYCLDSKGSSVWRAYAEHISKCLPGYINDYIKKEYVEGYSDIFLNKGEQYGPDDIGYILSDVARILSYMPYWFEDTADDLLSVCTSSEYHSFKVTFP